LFLITERWTCAFGVATKATLRGESSIDPIQLTGILHPSEVAKMASFTHPGLYAASKIRRAVKQAIHHVESEENVSTKTSGFRALWMEIFDMKINSLVGQVGGMERTKATPLPLPYVSHLRTCLLLQLLIMPHMFYSSYQLWTIPIVAVVSFLLLGLEAAATDCVCPFENRTNHLNMDGFCGTLIRDIGQILTQLNYTDPV